VSKRFIQCCQRVLLYTSQSSRILSRFAPFSLAIVRALSRLAPCTVPSYPTHGARRDIMGTPFVFCNFIKMGFKMGRQVTKNIQGWILFQTNTFKNLKYYKFMRYAASKKVSRFAPLSPKGQPKKTECVAVCQQSSVNASMAELLCSGYTASGPVQSGRVMEPASRDGSGPKSDHGQQWILLSPVLQRCLTTGR